jgi:hypothetical protein
MRRLLATDVRSICFGMVSWIAGNGFVGWVFGVFLRFFGRRRPRAEHRGGGKIGPFIEKFK